MKTRPGLAARGLVVPHVREAKLKSSLFRWTGRVFLRLTAPSAEKWAIEEALSPASQDLTSGLPSPERGQRSGRLVFASHPGGLWPFWFQTITSFSIYLHPRMRGPIFSQPSLSQNTPSSFTSGRLLWLYDYIWGFVWLCMYLHHSQLVPINNRAPV